MIRVLDTGTILIIGMDGETIEIMGAVITCTEEAEVRTLGPLVYEEVVVLRARELAELRGEVERLDAELASVRIELAASLAEAAKSRIAAALAAMVVSQSPDRFALAEREVDAWLANDRARREAAELAADEAVTP